MDDFIYSESPCCMMHPNKFLLKRIYGSEVVWKIPRRLFSAWPSFVSKWNEKAFTSLFLASSIQSSFCSWGHMVWRRMLFDKYQDCCLVLGHPDILFILSLHVVWFLFKRTYVFEEEIARRIPRGLFNAWPSLISEWNNLSNSGAPFALVSAQEDIWFGRRYCLKYWRELPWRHNTQLLPALESSNPSLMPYKLSHCAL